MRALFAVTLAVSAFLLFLIQPLVGRQLLPLVGGTPAVWNVCLVFFQATLFAGYLYAHLSGSRLSLGASVGVHVVLLVGASALLVLGVSPDVQLPASDTGLAEIAWLLTHLATTLGVPLVLIAAHAPLLQRWFSRTIDRDAGDPNLRRRRCVEGRSEGPRRQRRGGRRSTTDRRQDGHLAHGCG